MLWITICDFVEKSPEQIWKHWYHKEKPLMNSTRMIPFLMSEFRSPWTSFNFNGYQFIANSYEKTTTSSWIAYALNLIRVGNYVMFCPRTLLNPIVSRLACTAVVYWFRAGIQSSFCWNVSQGDSDGFFHCTTIQKSQLQRHSGYSQTIRNWHYCQYCPERLLKIIWLFISWN